MHRNIVGINKEREKERNQFLTLIYFAETMKNIFSNNLLVLMFYFCLDFIVYNFLMSKYTAM